MTPTERFEELRPRLHGIAYRMTGSVSDAEDVCQEAWLRWADVDHASVANPEAFLVTTTSRLAIDRIRRSERRRETYVGPYLPEPVIADPAAEDPAEHAALADSLTYAFLVVLDELSPVERAVLLLHDVFGYPFDEVADAVDRTPTAVRQIASRSRKKVAGRRAVFPRADDDTILATMGGLLAAVARGDVEAVMTFLAPDVVELADGGGIRRAGMRPVVGAERVARLMVNLSRRNPHLAARYVEVNGRPGMVYSDGDEPYLVMTAELDEEGRVARIFSQLNPEKLTHVEP